MKTPREILLNGIRAAAPKLDAIRREVVKVAADVNRRKQPVRELTFAADTGKCHPAFVSGTDLALPPDLDGPGGGLDFDFHLQFLAAGQI